VPLKLGPITLPFGKSEDDPYWERFLKTVPYDKRNAMTEMLRQAPEGVVAPVKSELHSPEITSTHIKELALYVGSDLTGVVRLPAGGEYPFAVVCVVKAEHDPREAPGIGGQVPVMTATLPRNHSRSISNGERWTCPLPPCGGGLGRGVSTYKPNRPS